MAKRNTRSTKQRLTVSGVNFKPARVVQAKAGAEGTKRKTKATTTVSFSTDELTDPAGLLDFVGTVNDRELAITITPDESVPWSGPGHVTGCRISPPKEDGPDRHSPVTVSIEVASDNPETHLDLFKCRIGMDGKDTWEAEVAFQLTQSDFTLRGGSGEHDPADDE